MNGHNRWFDKGITIVCMPDGRMGFNGEPYLSEPFTDPPNCKKEADLPPPLKLTWKVDDHLKKCIQSSEQYVKKLIADSDGSVINYTKYGSDFIKSKGKQPLILTILLGKLTILFAAKVSPDAYIQMALQLTYYRIHKSYPAVYETASTRKYLHGRTETCRSLSTDSAEFARSFDEPGATATTKVNALRRACTSHVAYISKASNGHGVDRHLLGLRMCMQPGEDCALYKDPMYARSQHWDLSTSGLFPGKTIGGAGFGAV
ncbi:hypothetical protein HDV05_002627, partial [Chytridiales sp. JEL 0842]